MTSDIDSKNANVEPPWVGQVIHFWFEELAEADWFAKSDSVDMRIRDDDRKRDRLARILLLVVGGLAESGLIGGG